MPCPPIPSLTHHAGCACHEEVQRWRDLLDLMGEASKDGFRERDALRAENENLLRLLSAAYEELRRRGVMSFPVPAPVICTPAPPPLSPYEHPATMMPTPVLKPLPPEWVEHKTVPATVGQEPSVYLAPCLECERSTTGRCGNHSWPVGYSTPVVR